MANTARRDGVESMRHDITSVTIGSVERAADVLLAFGESNDDGLGITDLATRLGLSKAAVHRVLASLRSRDLIMLDETTRRYFLGPAAITLGLRALDSVNVRRLAQKHLAALSEQTQETATLSVRAGDMRVYVDQVTPRREVIMTVTLGISYPLHAGSSSKAFLAFLGQKEIERYLASSLIAVTPMTETDPVRLRQQLLQIRRSGYAESAGERQAGAASVAAPILDSHDVPLAVISVCGPADRFLRSKDLMIDKLLELTRFLSAQAGHQEG